MAAIAIIAGAVAAPILVHADVNRLKPNEQTAKIPRFRHVFYIMMENTGSSELLGNPKAPFINHLIRSYGYDTQYYGVTHTSLPNYVAAISGNNWYSNHDNPTQSFPHSNLVGQLTRHHITWKGYMQSLPSPGWQGYWYPDNQPKGTAPSVTPPNALYAKKHNPFLLFPQIANNPALANNVVPLRQLSQDLAANQVPQFAWISPNVINDMHGQPPGPGATVTYANESQLIARGDQFLKTWVTRIMHSKAWTGNSVIFITWDEASYPGSHPSPSQIAQFTASGPDSPILPAGTVNGMPWPGGPYGGGNVPLIVIARKGPHPLSINLYADHYSILRTIEKSWHLSYLGMASDASQVHSLAPFFRSSH